MRDRIQFHISEGTVAMRILTWVPLFRVNKEYEEWSGHGGYPMVPEELKGRAISMPYDAKEVLERL
jgi:hypothetical protein